MTEILDLQDLDVEVEVETPADVYRSTNSVYACTLTSAHSLVC